ncbi:hypothetical protein GCM10011452_09310 [Gemmobacter lanyuensis]|uniref:HNH nuclease domain-containing protein n=1 Tax=Gemmobacter lanyuensis TaxID=1054497 RepID=A0A918IQF8_9RHOB|nr:hypothetical protein GCM10011452_09310 [Gemmobacter lanyuensis]
MVLKRLPPRIAALPPMVRFVDSTPAEASRARDARVEWRKWYKTARWQELRWRVLERDGFVCRFCGAAHPVLAPMCHALASAGCPSGVPRQSASGFVADHVTPHRGDASLFWDERNLQCLCAKCHNSTKQAEEKGRGGVNP